MSVTFVIGGNYTGKSHFIAQHFNDDGHVCLNVYGYQLRMDKEEPSLPHRDRLFRANELLLEDILTLIGQGRDVVIEQTFFKALRRITFIDAIRAVSDTPIDVYVMAPSDEQLLQNCRKRLEGIGASEVYAFDRVKEELEELFEFPNPAEGFTHIYQVTDGVISLRTDPPDDAAAARAREELRAETAYRQKKQAERDRHERLVQACQHIKFWHYCEVCGKKELLTADEAFEAGWDYPPHMYHFRDILTPRTCGHCFVCDTVSFKLLTGKKTFSQLTAEERETLDRINREPESLLPEDFDGSILDHFDA